MRVVATGEGQTRNEREGVHGWWRDESVHINIVLQRQLSDGVAGTSRLNLDRTPSVGNVHKLRCRQVVFGDVHGSLQLWV